MRGWRVSLRTSALPLALGLVAWCVPMPQVALADPPEDDAAAVEVAQATTDSLISALLAAVVDITTRTTSETVVPESQAISLLLPPSQKAYRLLDASGDPINPRNKPRGKFERDALKRAAMDGETTQVVKRGKLLTVVPLPFAAQNCALCHANYVEDFELGDIVGAISLRVPLLDGEDDDDEDD